MKDLDQLIEQLEVVLAAFHSAMDTPEIPDTKGAREVEQRIGDLFPEAGNFVHGHAVKAGRSDSRLFELADQVAQLQPSVRESPNLVRILCQVRQTIAEESSPPSSSSEPSQKPRTSAKLVGLDIQPGTKWGHVGIRLLDSTTALVKVGNNQESLGFTALGFEDERKKEPNNLWYVMTRLAMKEGRLAKEEIPVTQWGILQTNIQRLNRCLEGFFGIEGRPISFNRRDRCYVAAFKIEANPDVLE